MLYIVYIYIIYIYYIYIWIYICIYVYILACRGFKSEKIPFPGSFFLVFLIPWPPLTYLIKAIWVFYVPLELCDILVISKKFGVIYQNELGRSCSGNLTLKSAQIGLFDNFQGINAPPDPTEHFQHDIYTYIYVYILYI